MKLFSRKAAAGGDPESLAPGTAVVTEEAPGEAGATTMTRRERAFSGPTDALLAEIDALSAANRDRPDPAAERRLLMLRHLAGVRLLDAAGAEPQHPDPDLEGLPAYRDGLPALAPEHVTPELLRAAILRDGCLLIRGLVPSARALALAAGIERSFAERERYDSGEPAAAGLYEEFELEPPFDPYLGRPWIKMGGGVYAADSPTLHFQMTELLREARLTELVSAYLGERALTSVHKTTLRKAEPSVPGQWHQDGKFMGPVRALNLWLSLSDCGLDAPGLDIVPRRLDVHVEPDEESKLEMLVSQRRAEQAAGERGILRPVFGPGDALLFDEMFLHQTGSDPSMPNPRFAVECWFFGASGFPSAYAPVAT